MKKATRKREKGEAVPEKQLALVEGSSGYVGSSGLEEPSDPPPGSGSGGG